MRQKGKPQTGGEKWRRTRGWQYPSQYVDFAGEKSFSASHLRLADRNRKNPAPVQGQDGAFWRQAERAEIQGAGAARVRAAFIIHKKPRNTRNLWHASFSGRNFAPAQARKARSDTLYTGYTGRSGYNPGQAGAGPTLFQGAGRRGRSSRLFPEPDGLAGRGKRVRASLLPGQDCARQEGDRKQRLASDQDIQQGGRVGTGSTTAGHWRENRRPCPGKRKGFVRTG